MLCQIVTGPQLHYFILKRCYLSWHRAWNGLRKCLLLTKIQKKNVLHFFNPNKHGPFWHLKHPGVVPIMLHSAHPVVPFSCTLLGRWSDLEALC